MTSQEYEERRKPVIERIKQRRDLIDRYKHQLTLTSDPVAEAAAKYQIQRLERLNDEDDKELAKLEQEYKPAHSATPTLDLQATDEVSTNDRNRLIDILVGIDTFVGDPGTFLQTVGLPRNYVNGLDLAGRPPTSLAGYVLIKLQDYGGLPDGQNAIGALARNLQASGLGTRDANFLKELLVQYKL